MVEETKEVMDIAASIQFMAERSLVKYSQELFVEIIWLGLRIWESDTVQGFRRR